MGNIIRTVETIETKCSSWNESEFVLFCQNELLPQDRKRLEVHLEICAECRERFAFCLEVILAESSPKENEADNEILKSSFWNKCKDDIVRQSFGMNRFYSRSKGAIAVAAMLLLTLLPIVFAYIMIFKPSRTPNLDSAKVILKESNMRIVADALESADRRLKLNPQDTFALFERGASLEKFVLLDDAKDDYLSILKHERDEELRNQAERRLQAIYLRASASTNAKPNRYLLLDLAIGRYLTALETSDSTVAYEAISKAEDIANDMEDLTGESFGQDLVEFYRNIKTDEAASLIEARRLRNEVEFGKSHQNYNEYLDQAYQAKAIFNNFGSACDSEQMDISIAKYLNKLGFYEQALQIADDGIVRAAHKKHLFTRAQFLFRRSENLDETSRFEESRKALEESIETARRLDVSDFVLRPLLRLGNLFFVMSENELALNQTVDTMRAAQTDKRQAFSIQPMQVLGISAFSLNYVTLSEICLRRSIKLAEAEHSQGMINQGHSFLGIVYAEQKRFKDADYHFACAERAIDEISDEASRKSRKLDAMGYQARAQMLAGKTEQAIKLYSDALSLSKELNTKQNLLLSQLHQGLGESLMARGDKKQAEAELKLSAKLEETARLKFEQKNILLSLAATRRTPQEQLDRLNSSSDSSLIRRNQ